MTDDELADFLRHLPTQPGVYRHIGQNDEVLYVGKAINLRKRVSSYFLRRQSSPRIALMVSKVVRTEVTVVASEKDALLLEANLIKTLKPRYNIVFRDDKTYPYVQLSTHAFAKIGYYRGSTQHAGRLFGPYPNAWAVKQSIHTLTKVFLLRTCEDSVFANRTRPCLQHQIKRCSAPCVGLIDEVQYQQQIKAAARFLNGETKPLIAELTAQMQTLSAELQFERAASVRDQLNALSSVLAQSDMSGDEQQNCDLVAVAVQGGMACVNLAMVRGGRHLGDRAFFPLVPNLKMVLLEGVSLSTDDNDCQQPPVLPDVLHDVQREIMSAFLQQHYAQQAMPPQVWLNVLPEEEDMSEFFATRQGIHISNKPQGIRRRWLELASGNAKIALTRRLAERGSAQQRTVDLAQILGLSAGEASEEQLPYGNIRLECFDISHTAGEATQASCVVYHSHQMQSKEYRRYNIASTADGDDYQAMREVLSRRYRRGDEGVAGQIPDIILIDGGKGQVSAALEVLQPLGIAADRIVGVAKGEGRKVGLETLVFADGRPPLQLGSHSPALMLIAQIRDEAHRFAITGMRAKRAKARTGQSLEDIAGLGAKRKQKLIARFGSVAGIAQAQEQELASVEGISPELAKRIYEFFQG